MKKPFLRTLAGALLLAAAAGCSSAGPAAGPPDGSPHGLATAAGPAATPAVTPAAISGDPYEAAIAQFHRLGLKVWADSDLAGRWLDGPAAFHEALVRDAHLARLPGVVGGKVADELGYNDGLDTPQQVQRFLDATAKGLHALAPGTKILVDMVVPDMGCLPWLASRLPQAGQCAQDERSAYPAATMAAVDGYLASGDIDQLDLSTGLRDPGEYASWGISIDQAQREAWAEAHRRGWQDETTLQARHAMAHPGDFPGDPATAWAEVNTYVRIPAEEGAADVQVWAWRQEYDGQTVRLMNPGLQPNPLWQALLAARRAGVTMSTTFTPSAMEVSLPADAHMIARVFSGVYVAAGTG
jgi:hypothetical protein